MVTMNGSSRPATDVAGVSDPVVSDVAGRREAPDCRKRDTSAGAVTTAEPIVSDLGKQYGGEGGIRTPGRVFDPTTV
jgi:hypothetical protein